MNVLLQPFSDAVGDEFPLEGATRDKLRAAVKYAILAPSTHNTQPWVFRVRDDCLELYADRTRHLSVVDPDDRELAISCGGALFHLRIALRHFGLAEETEVLPDRESPDLLVRVRIAGAHTPTAEEHALFAAIGKRHTDRFPFDERPIPPEVQAGLIAAARRAGAWLAVFETAEERTGMAELIGLGDRLQMADVAFRRELAAWMRPNRSRRRDGLPGAALGLRELAAALGPLIVRTFDIGGRRAAHDEELARSSPILAVLGTAGEHPTAWLAAGQALAHVLLQAQVDGVSASFLNQPIEVPRLRRLLEMLVGHVGHAQMVLRLGYSTRAHVRPTPRRLLRSVVRG